MSGKGDRQRPSQIDKEEESLRWELIDKKTTKERKEEILRILDKSVFPACTLTDDEKNQLRNIMESL